MLIHALRVTTMLALLLGALQALFVTGWYVRVRLVGPHRLFHIASVGTGVLLAYKQMFLDVMVLYRDELSLSWTSPTCLAATLFISLGVHFLFLDARAVERRYRRRL